MALGQPPAYPFQRPRVGQDAGIFDQQSDVAGADYRRALQEPLAGGVVLQMDQAASAHQALPWHKRERGEDANLVRRHHLCADCYRQKGASPRCLALHFATDLVGLDFGENRDFMRLAARCQQNDSAHAG